MRNLLLPEETERVMTEAQRGYYVAIQTLGAAAIMLFKYRPILLNIILNLAQALLDEMFTLDELKREREA